MTPILDAHAPPHMRQVGSKAQGAVQHLCHAFRSLRENLIGVPVSSRHDASHANDVLVGNVGVEQVAHRVDEHTSACGPEKWLWQLFGHEPQVETLLVRMSLHAAKSFGECRSIAMSTAWADLRATSNRIPCCVGPFNPGVVAHNSLSE